MTDRSLISRRWPGRRPGEAHVGEWARGRAGGGASGAAPGEITHSTPVSLGGAHHDTVTAVRFTSLHARFV